MFVLGITGASGTVYGVRLLELLLSAGAEVHTVVSPVAKLVLRDELNGLEPNDDSRQFLLSAIEHAGRQYGFRFRESSNREKLFVHRPDDFFAPIASGSFATDGMIVCPCTGSSLGHIASGINRHLIHRAAEVHLKERRPLILVLRETPLSSIHLKNLQTVAEAGGTILPATPHFYGNTQTVADLVDSVVAKILDQLRVPHPIENRWQIRDQGSDSPFVSL